MIKNSTYRYLRLLTPVPKSIFFYHAGVELEKELIEKLKEVKGVKAFAHKTLYQISMHKLHNKILSTLQKGTRNGQYIIHRDTLYIRTGEKVHECPAHRHLPSCSSVWDLRKYIKDQQFLHMTPQVAWNFIDETELYCGSALKENWWKPLEDFNPPKTPTRPSSSEKHARAEQYSGNLRQRTRPRMEQDS